MTADEYADWLHGPREEDCCAECGASADEPCDRACPLGGEGACAVCGLPWARWVESLGEARCDACGPMTTIHARCARGDL